LVANNYRDELQNAYLPERIETAKTDLPALLGSDYLFVL
jgi:hypothetical protein